MSTSSPPSSQEGETATSLLRQKLWTCILLPLLEGRTMLPLYGFSKPGACHTLMPAVVADDVTLSALLECSHLRCIADSHLSQALRHLGVPDYVLVPQVTKLPAISLLQEVTGEWRPVFSLLLSRGWLCALCLQSLHFTMDISLPWRSDRKS